jgi:diguanylate cyclase (GGDEF)-like protein
MASGERRRLDSYIAETVSLGKRLSVLGISLLDHRGIVVVAHGSEEAAEEIFADNEFMVLAINSDEATWRRYPKDNNETLAVSMPVVSGLRFGTLVAEFDSSDVIEAIDDVRWSIGLVTTLAVIFAAGGVWFAFFTTVVGPLKRLMNAAEAVANGDFEVRLGSQRVDEVGRLSQAFDRMASQLRSYTKGLERRVAEESAEVARQSVQLQQVNSRLQVAVSELERLAVTDALTGLSNRRHFDHMLANEMERSVRSGTPMTLMLLDVDHFKRYNDTYGHPAGDDALKMLATVLRKSLRRTDFVARWGGEEFAILLLDTGATPSLIVADKLRKAIHSAQQTGTPRDDGPEPLTVSLGMASAPSHATDPNTLLQLADKALYTAKRSGRDRAVLVGEAHEVDDADSREPET